MRLTLLSIALAAICCLPAFGQDERPLIDIVGSEAADDISAEDIPPPAPVPDATTHTHDDHTHDDHTHTHSTPSGAEENAYDFGVSYRSTNEGLKVSGVIVGSRASAAGVKPGDVIVSVNGGVPSSPLLQNNQVQNVTVVRNGSQQTLPVGAATRSGSTTAGYSPSAPQATATYVPQSQAAYSVPRTAVDSAPAGTAVYSAPRTTAYSVPRATYSAPRSYRYAPSYNYRYAPNYAYRTATPYSARYSSYARRPAVSIGFGVGGGRGGFGPGLGYGGFGPSFGRGFGPSFGGYGFGGRGVGIGRSGFGISIGF